MENDANSLTGLQQPQPGDSLYRDVVENQTELIVRWNFQDHVTFVNDAVCRFLGLSRPQILGKPFTPFASEADASKLRQHLLTLTPWAPLATFEHRVSLPDGQVRWTQWTHRALFDPAGELVMIQSVGRDIHEQKLAAEALYRRMDVASYPPDAFTAAPSTEDGSRTLAIDGIGTNREEVERWLRLKKFSFDNVGEAISWTSSSGEILNVNDAWCRMLGVTREEIIGKTVGELDPRFAGDAWTAHWEEVRKRGTFKFDYQCGTRYGHVLDVEVSVNHLVLDGQEYNCSFIRDISERKRAERALRDGEAAIRESEARYRRAERGTNDGLWEWDIITGKSYRSPRWLEMLGYTQGDLSHDFDSFGKLLHPDDQARVQAETKAHLESFHPFDVELRMRCKDGKYLWVRTRGEAERDANGTPFRMTGAITDISERKRTEELLSGERDRLRQILDAQFAFVVELSLDGAVVDINRTPLLLAGLLREDVLGKRFWEVGWFEPGEEVQVEAAVREARRGDSVRSEVAVYFPSVGRRCLDTIFYPLWNAAGEVTNVVAFGVDITERKEIERSLLESESRLKEAQRIGQLGSLDWNLVTGRLILSDETLRIYGLNPTRNQILPVEMTSMLHPQDRSAVEKSLTDAIAGIAKHDMEYRMIRPDGQEVHVKASAEIFRGPGGCPIRLLGTVLDVTEQKRAEEALKKSEHFAAIGRMAARVAHEINNPLAGIRNSFDLVKDAVPQTHVYHSYVHLIEKEIARIARIVHQMLELYRPAAEPIAELCMRQVLQEVVSILELRARCAGVRVSIDLGNDNVRLHLPENWIWQILFNLIQNAIEACESNSGEVRLGIRATQDRCVLTVSDNGGGIGPCVLKRLYEPFFTTKRDVDRPGLGLGLSVSKNLVESMGGTIDVESQVGVGTTFRVELPMAKNHQASR